MTTILVVQIPPQTAADLRRLADRHGLEGVSLHALGGYMLQALVEMLEAERKRERVG